MPRVLVKKQLSDRLRRPTNFINILRNSRKQSKDEPIRPNHGNVPSIEVVDLEPETLAVEQKSKVKGVGDDAVTSKVQISDDVQRNLILSHVVNEQNGTKYFVLSGADRGIMGGNPESRPICLLERVDVSTLPPPTPPDPPAGSSGRTSQCFYVTERVMDSEANEKVPSLHSEAPDKLLFRKAKHDYSGPSRALYLALEDCMPDQWDIRVSSEGAHAMLWAEGFPSAIQREIMARFDGSALRVAVHSRTLPADHELFSSPMMVPTVRLTSATVGAFANVILSALHAVQHYRTCCGIVNASFTEAWTQHPKCRLDENQYRESAYSQTLRPLDCRLLIRDREDRCERCDYYVENSKTLPRAEKDGREKAETQLRANLPSTTVARFAAGSTTQQAHHGIQRKKPRLLSRLRAAPRAIRPARLLQGAILLQVIPPATFSHTTNPQEVIPPGELPLVIPPAAISQAANPQEVIPPEELPQVIPQVIPPEELPQVIPQVIPPEELPQVIQPAAISQPAPIPQPEIPPETLPPAAILRRKRTLRERLPPALASERSRGRIAKLVASGSREIDSELYAQLALVLSGSGGLVSLLWSEQCKLNAGMPNCTKLHPFLLRWALNEKTLYTKGYQAMRAKGFIQLPNGRHLYEYHVSPEKLGFQKHALKTLTEHQVSDCDNSLLKCHIVFIELVYVYMNVVYQKGTGEVVGYVRLDDVEDESVQIEREILGDRADGPPQYSKILLSYLVKGVTNGIRAVVACHAGGVSLEELHEKTWEVVGNLEASGIQVIALVGAGNLVNQLFDRYQPVTGTDSRVVFDTKNVCAADGRPLFLLNDFSEILKRIRNCFANSGAHKHTRLLTKNGSVISWQTIIDILLSEGGPHFEKITPLHVFLNSNSIIKWYIAAQTMSRSVADVIEQRGIPGTEETVKFIRYVNDVNDCLSGTHLTQAAKKKNLNLAPYKSESDYRFFFLMEFLGYLKKWEEEVRELPLLESERKRRVLSPQVLTETERTVRAFIGALKYLLGRRRNAEGIMASVFQENPLEFFYKTPTIAGVSENLSYHRSRFDS